MTFKTNLNLNLNLMLHILREHFLQTRVSSAQKSNESDSRLRNLGKVKMAGNFFYRACISRIDLQA